jgi:hypothetical protein
MLLMTPSLPNQYAGSSSAEHSSGQFISGLADKLSPAETGRTGRKAARPVKFESLLPRNAYADDKVSSRNLRQSGRADAQTRPLHARADLALADRRRSEMAAELDEEAKPKAIKPEQLEQAAAFAAALMQILLPAEPVPTAVLSNATEDPGEGMTLPPTLDDVLSQSADGQSTVLTGTESGASEALQSALEFSIAGDGAIECDLKAKAADETLGSEEATALSGLELTAELDVPGQPVVRVGFGGPGRVDRSGQAVAEKFAQDSVAKMNDDSAIENDSEIKIVNAGSKQVSNGAGQAGIAVAKGKAAMSTAPYEVISSVRSSGAISDGMAQLGVLGESGVVDQNTASTPELVPANFAERAVATVTGLAEAQFSVSMQKAGRVQLRLKFGGEDLNVRIELRDGVVHTTFHSDSKELRAAIMQEWQNVAASAPGRLHQFLDPIFSAGSAQSADAGAQGQSFHRPQQQAQEQAAARSEGWTSANSFSRRSVLSESFSPEPAVARLPLHLPTSLRLSALA